MTPRMTAYSAIVWASSPQRDRSQLKKAIPGDRRAAPRAECLVLGIPSIRRECEATPDAAPPPGPGAPLGAAGICPGGAPADGDLLLPLVLERASRRSVRPLDAGRAHSSVRS